METPIATESTCNAKSQKSTIISSKYKHQQKKMPWANMAITIKEKKQ